MVENSARNRGQLFADRVQAPFVVLQLPLGALELRLSLRERGAGFRGGGFGRSIRFLEILDALRRFLVSDGERVAVERQGGMLRPQALVPFGQSLEFPLGLKVSDFRALDLDQRLVDRRQDIVELGADGLDVAERELDGVQMGAQAFVAPADRVESARDLERLRFPISGQIGGRERPGTGEGGAGIGREASPPPAHSEWRGGASRSRAPDRS